MIEKISVADARRESAVGRRVMIEGWVRTRRDSKAGFSFLEVNDGSCFGNVQILVEQGLANYETEVLRLTAGASVRVVGNVQASPGKGQATELAAEEVMVYGFADPEHYPLQKKRHSLEFLRQIAHLRPRTNTIGAAMRVRNAISFSLHRFFQERGFLYVHTPIITASDCEGAGEMFQVTTLNLVDTPRIDGKVDYSQDFFDRPSYLTVSGQLEAEAFACGLGKAYTFGPTFRAENSNTARHLAEFWMVEPEMAFCDLQGNMDLAEALLRQVFSEVLSGCGEDMAFFNQFLDPTTIETLEGIVAEPFERMTYTEAIRLLRNADRTFEFPVEWGVDLQSEHERYLTEEVVRKPVILCDYPRTIKPFYMRMNDDEATVRAMDVLVPKVGEIIGGSQREERLEVLEGRMKEQGLNPEDYWWYLDLRRYGTVPHAGFGLGLERVVQFVTGIANIREVIPFPRTPGNAEF
ncbi:MAG TPA: asparagine--tRNA ligase [Verrucomicrobia bacterium]|jgi:asparaginyl-tRNA synthetase|nr:asparagine--tRNA ligase [Verrucomicrobiota bacterium]